MLQRNAQVVARRRPVLTLVLAAFAPMILPTDEAMAQAFLRASKPEPRAVRPVQKARPVAARNNVKRATPRKPVRRARAAGPASSTANLAEAVSLQAALDRVGFSAGIIDGQIGRKTQTGLKAFQNAAGIPATGQLDEPTRRALGVDAVPATTPYRLTAEDVAMVGDCPTNWNEKAKLKRLGFDSLASVGAFRGHCTKLLLTRLNVGKDVSALKAGDIVVIPNVAAVKSNSAAARVQIDFGTKMVHAFDANGKLLALFHCSIAKETSQRPGGACKVATVTMNPEYTFNPEKWPEVKNVNRVLQIPPGPRNPVGLCWIGLDKDGYGIHGTPEPEMIGKTGSHGCIRLTNWDVLRLAEMIKVGTEVSFIDSAANGQRLANAGQ